MYNRINIQVENLPDTYSFERGKIFSRFVNFACITFYDRLCNNKMKNKKNDHSDTLWAVRGVSQEAKNAAKIAAKKSATSLGIWLSRKIIEAAQNELTKKSKAIARQEDVFDILENLSNKFDKDLSDLRGQIEEMKSQKRPWLQSLFNKNSKS